MIAGVRVLRPLMILASLGLALLIIGMLLTAFPIDLPLVVAVNALHVGPVAAVTDGVYAALEPPFAALIVITAAGVVWWRAHRAADAALFTFTVAAAWLPIGVAKIIVARPRPDLSMLAHPHAPWPTDSSFPSGHTAFAAAFVLALWVVVGRGTRGSRPLLIVGGAFVMLVAACVLINGIHYPTDVAASLIWIAVAVPVAHTLGAQALAAWGSRHRVLRRQAGVPSR